MTGENEKRLAYGINEFCEMANVSRTTIYKDIADGRLRAVKNGRRTMILRADAVAFFASLPAFKPHGSVGGRA